MAELEVPQVMADEFKQRGEETSVGVSRTLEESFKQYDPKLKEQEVSRVVITLKIFVGLYFHR